MAGLVNRFARNALNGYLGSGVIKAMLVTPAYAFNPDHNTVSQVAAQEVSGTGYTGGFAGSGRKTLGSISIAQDDAANRGYFDAADLTWTGINVGDVAGVWFYKQGSSDADSELIGFMDTGGFPVTTNGGNLVVQFSASPLGVLELSV